MYLSVLGDKHPFLQVPQVSHCPLSDSENSTPSLMSQKPKSQCLAEQGPWGVCTRAVAMICLSSDWSGPMKNWWLDILNIIGTSNNGYMPGWMLKSLHARIGSIVNSLS